jgi:aspartate/methionine/tyrosine aminotransferase
MKIELFKMERMQSTWENLVDYNLSESGVHPMTLRELVEDDADTIERLLKQELGYVQSNGTPELRDLIAQIYPGATRDHVLVTNGTAEANLISALRLTDRDDEIVLMLPNYMQLWGLTRALGGNVRPFYLREENAWHPDLDELRSFVSKRTKLIAVCNPNNPTGAILSQAEMDEIIRVADSCGAWLLADEVYRGAELENSETKSFWGKYDRTIITSGLSKAYGIPGLRIGWIVSAPQFVAECWSYHDYTTIGTSILSDILARVALQPAKRQKILERTRGILRTNFPVLQDWIANHGSMFSMIAPKAGAIAYFKYKLNVNSTELVEKLRTEKSVLIVPGDHFGMDRYLRIGYGPPADYLKTGLDRIHETLVDLID